MNAGFGKILDLFGNGDGESLDHYYPVRPECKDDVPPCRFRPQRGKTLSQRKWESCFSSDGRLDVARIIKRVQRGGIHPSIRGPAWEFILGCFDPNSTTKERNQIRQERRDQYYIWKARCQKMAPVIGSGKIVTTPLVSDDGTSASGGNNRPNSMERKKDDKSKELKWKYSLHQIGLDVLRTDRALSFYESESNQAKLSDVLAVYSWVDSDIGYVQGMNDICSPMVMILEDEGDAFWCFYHAMRKLRENFRSSDTSLGVQSQLTTLSTIIQTVDPELHQHLEDVAGGQYLFAIRMLMVLFRREFSFMDSLYLWELIWGMEYNPNLYSIYNDSREASASDHDQKHLKQCGKFERKIVKTGLVEEQSALAVFLLASILETKKKKLLNEASAIDDVVEIMGGITGKFDARKACKEALKIQKQYLDKTKK
ncbi:hypothetical protein MLD38_023981 [Melastoma candidum]|uniref:Uncharacterized protein n=1 Tax=Melastoma candidum TaxID=119954 RepID=A0ACB9NS71_9MYRT|nr:hypothetical protein MLD38_023981 [Melastoma candidum]